MFIVQRISVELHCHMRNLIFWDVDKIILPFEFIVSFVHEYYEQRNAIIHVPYLMLDESMLGWQPKTSMHGGQPNISYEPRMPVPLRTMIRNAVECTTGILVEINLLSASLEGMGQQFILQRSQGKFQGFGSSHVTYADSICQRQ